MMNEVPMFNPAQDDKSDLTQYCGSRACSGGGGEFNHRLHTIAHHQNSVLTQGARERAKER
jgi:hypothetical protein